MTVAGLASIVPGEPPGDPKPGPGSPQVQLRFHRGGRRHRRQVNSQYTYRRWFMIKNRKEGRLYSVQYWAPADQHYAEVIGKTLS
jgi:hypothetical protein